MITPYQQLLASMSATILGSRSWSDEDCVETARSIMSLCGIEEPPIETSNGYSQPNKPLKELPPESRSRIEPLNGGSYCGEVLEKKINELIEAVNGLLSREK